MLGEHVCISQEITGGHCTCRKPVSVPALADGPTAETHRAACANSMCPARDTDRVTDGDAAVPCLGGGDLQNGPKHTCTARPAAVRMRPPGDRPREGICPQGHGAAAVRRARANIACLRVTASLASGGWLGEGRETPPAPPRRHWEGGLWKSSNVA